MESETGCKIMIRGRGSVKEGSRGKNNGKYDDEDDELHVYIQGETDEDVANAVALVKPLLVPVDDETNVHKQDQLRELALINGTLVGEEFCEVCGKQGHRSFACPSRDSKEASLAAANVR